MIFLHSKVQLFLSEKGALILIGLFEKNDADVILGISTAKKRPGASIFQNIFFVNHVQNFVSTYS